MTENQRLDGLKKAIKSLDVSFRAIIPEGYNSQRMQDRIVEMVMWAERAILLDSPKQHPAETVAELKQ